jgi:aspartyl-tRNA(Asn)/glutamyl-tRNA(Gln) amidotransferase subunit A
MINSFTEAFRKCDCIALPCTPSSAFKLGAIQDPLEMYLQDIFTIAANLAGLPAVSLPSGFDAENKPLGMQLLGPQQADVRILKYAYAFEQACNASRKIPPLFCNKGTAS